MLIFYSLVPPVYTANDLNVKSRNEKCDGIHNAHMSSRIHFSPAASNLSSRKDVDPAVLPRPLSDSSRSLLALISRSD